MGSSRVNFTFIFPAHIGIPFSNPTRGTVFVLEPRLVVGYRCCPETYAAVNILCLTIVMSLSSPDPQYEKLTARLRNKADILKTLERTKD